MSKTPRRQIQYKHDTSRAVTLRKICFIESFERRVTRVVRTSCRVLKALQRRYCITKNYDALRVEIGLQIYFRLRREETAGNMFVTCTRYASFPELSLSTLRRKWKIFVNSLFLSAVNPDKSDSESDSLGFCKIIQLFYDGNHCLTLGLTK